MADEFVIMVEQKSYTWDGQRWYGTFDYMMPPFALTQKLNTMIPKIPVLKVKKSSRRLPSA
jgi:hypothetical protein